MCVWTGCWSNLEDQSHSCRHSNPRSVWRHQSSNPQSIRLSHSLAFTPTSISLTGCDLHPSHAALLSPGSPSNPLVEHLILTVTKHAVACNELHHTHTLLAHFPSHVLSRTLYCCTIFCRLGAFIRCVRSELALSSDEPMKIIIFT